MKNMFRSLTIPDALRSSAGQRLEHWKSRILKAWRGYTPREQTLLALAGCVVVVAVAWLLILKPVLHSIDHSRSRIVQLHGQAAELQAVILQNRALREQSRGHIEPEALDSALQDSLVRTGLAPHTQWQAAQADDTVAQNHYIIEFKHVTITSVLDWLAHVPGVLSLRVETLDLSRSKEDGRELPNLVDGRLVLLVPPGDSP